MSYVNFPYATASKRGSWLIRNVVNLMPRHKKASHPVKEHNARQFNYSIMMIKDSNNLQMVQDKYKQLTLSNESIDVELFNKYQAVSNRSYLQINPELFEMIENSGEMAVLRYISKVIKSNTIFFVMKPDNVDCGYSSYYSAVNSLVDKNIIHKISKRNTYGINPNYIWKGNYIAVYLLDKLYDSMTTLGIKVDVIRWFSEPNISKYAKTRKVIDSCERWYNEYLRKS